MQPIHEHGHVKTLEVLKHIMSLISGKKSKRKYRLRHIEFIEQINGGYRVTIFMEDE